MDVRVICVGMAVLDRIYSTPELPSGDGKNFATDYREVGGGPAANAAVTVQRLGGTATLWARLGDDSTGDTIADELRGYGVNVDRCQRYKGRISGNSAVALAQDGGRAILNYADPDMPRDTDWLPLDDLDKADAMLCDLRWNEGATAAFQAGRAHGIPCVLDADTMPMGGRSAAHEAASHVLFSRPGLAQFAGIDTVEAGLRDAATRLDGWVGVTDGADGVYWREDGETKHMRAFKVKVVDTLGAGDVFHGAFVLALGHGLSEFNALRFASAVAAVKCTRPGGRAGIPDIGAVNKFLGEYDQ